jgi:OFA family oxalate/formate antiporter-like MFS transporter
LGEAVRTVGFYLCWLMLCINVMAGMSVISQAMPMTQSFIENNAATQPFLPETAALAGVLVLVFAISNGVFRPFWALLSDKIGRAQVFLILFATQAITFLILGFAPPSLTLFVILLFYQYSCLGGGFAVMPAMAADKFGTKYAGRIYGWMLTAWGVAGLIGPTMYAQIVNSHPDGVGVPQAYMPALIITGAVFAVACILPVVEIKLSKKVAIANQEQTRSKVEMK